MFKYETIHVEYCDLLTYKGYCLDIDLRKVFSVVRNDQNPCSFQGIDAKEWKVVVQEIVRFMKADVACEISRPLRYSVLLDPHPSSIPTVDRLEGVKPLRLEDAILASYYHSEVSCLF